MTEHTIKKSMFATAWIDYFATGEGATYCVYVGGNNHEMLKERFIKTFGDFMAKGLMIEEGIPEYLIHIIPDGVKTMVESVNNGSKECPGNFYWHGEYHVNYS